MSKNINPQIFCGTHTRWRTVAKIAVRSPNPYEPVKFGLFLPNSHRVINCDNNSVHHPSINNAIKAVRNLCSYHKTPGYNEATGEGFLKYVMFGVSTATNSVQVTLVWNSDENEDRKDLSGRQFLNALVDGMIKFDEENSHSAEHRPPCSGKPLQDIRNKLTSRSEGDPQFGSQVRPAPLFHSIWIHFHPASKHTNSITGREGSSWKLIYGPDAVTERLTAAGMQEASGTCPTLHFPPNVFRQANLEGFSKIIKEIRNWVHPGGKCMELYGGVGTIGLNCLDLFSSLVCSDENPFNQACFSAALASLPKELSDRAVYLPLGASQMVLQPGFQDYDTLILDPPRKGLDTDVLNMILKGPSRDINSKKRKRKRGGDGVPAQDLDEGVGRSRGVQRLVYVSCGFKAFQRDMDLLTGGGGATPQRRWKCIHVEGHVLFPGSDHVETLAIFERLLS